MLNNYSEIALNQSDALKTKILIMFCCFCRTVTICNRSDIIVHFKWSNFATLREELQQKDRFINLFFQLTKHTFLLNRHLIIISLLILRKYCCFCSLCKLHKFLIFELSWNILFFYHFKIDFTWIWRWRKIWRMMNFLKNVSTIQPCVISCQ